MGSDDNSNTFLLAAGICFMLIYFLCPAIIGAGLDATNGSTSSGSGTTTDSGNLNVTSSNPKDNTFLLTSFHPCVDSTCTAAEQNMEGGPSLSSGWHAELDPSSPTGYVAKYSSGGKDYKYDYAFAVSQHSPTIPLQMGAKFLQGASIDGIIFLPLDHYASCASSNSIDIMATVAKYKIIHAEWEKKGLIVGTGDNGCGSTDRLKASIVDITAALK